MKKFFSLFLLAGSALGVSQERAAVGQPVGIDSFGSVDTRQFFPQIDHTAIKRLTRPENPSLLDRPWLRPGAPTLSPPNNLLPGIIVGPPSTQKQAYFRGPEDPFSDPPDPCAGVGPNNLVFVVNTRLAFYSKTGTEQFAQDLATFFGSAAETDFQFDPKVVFDHISNRWYVICLDGFTSSSPAERSNILLAVSDDADPNGSWFKYRVDSTVLYNGNKTWLDYASLGYNKDGIFMGGNSFFFAGGAPGCSFFVVKKADVLSGGTQNQSAFVIKDEVFETWSPQAVENFDPSLNKTYFVNPEFTQSSSTQIQVHRIENITTTPTKTTTTVSVPSYSPPVAAAQSTNIRTLDSLDGRGINGVYQPGKMAIAHTIDVSNRCGVRWYLFDVNTATNAVTLNQSGNITQAGADMHMGSIGMNALGDLAVTFTRSSSSIAADIMTTGRKAAAAAGTMGTPVRQEASAGNSYNVFRWGDYSSTSVDPSNSIGFWGAHMNIRADNDWRTGFFSFFVTTPMASVSVAPSSVVGGTNATGTITLAAVANGDTAVNLSSSDPTAATVPSSATVTSGSSTKTFTVSTSVVTSTKNVIITATQGPNVKTANLTVTVGAAPDLSSVTTSQTTIGGGRTVTGTVTLTGPAVGSGSTVTLSDNGPELTVPASVTVPAGQSSATFSVFTAQVSANVTRTITATLDAIVKTKNVLIVPYILTNFTMSPSGVISGNSATGTVTLNTFAPTAGKVVTLSDNSAALITPSSVTVPNGAASATFSVGTTVTSVPITRSVTATLNGVSMTRNLNVLLPDITSITATPTTVKGGNPVSCTIFANGTPGNGFVVNLTSSGAPLSVPASVTFVYGKTSHTFNATTSATVSTQVKFITATRNGRTRTVTITITP